ncbi:hypothetical protein [Segetibacter aerophilus]|uniref:Uncharacterized protein n=1 Tax=Segetibacter aerophilus TaxID=670293 RepID=A0A512BJK9_9BACT|nr:hypothetical protein [Segetibacter aerophilus]GEO12144.1 hypothetical protein SAE01_46400 [Segetibacter aerophilus]
MRKIFLPAFVTAIVLLSCTKVDPPAPTPPIPVPTKDTNLSTTTPPVISPTVYVAGDSFDLSSLYLPYPIYWKNGIQVHLPHPGYASGSGMAVSDTVVYVSSGGSYSGNNVTYWKNSVPVDLSDPSITYPTAKGITLSGGNLYTLGGAYINNFDKFVPIYWKNQDAAIKMPTYSSDDGLARAICVSGTDVYIAGSASDLATGYGSSPPCYWKNGKMTFLHLLSPSSEKGFANSIYVSGPDIYVVGEVYPLGSGSGPGWAVYWKNGVPIELTPPGQISVANCVTIVGNDVYIAGGIAGPNRLTRATYWKNGVPTQLDSTYSVANSITVFENDVYVAGNRGVGTALYWKNGTPIILGRGRANAIEVRK